MELLNIKNLQTNFKIDAGTVRAVRGIDLYLEEGESIGIVGESGSGKSVTMLSIMRLLENNGEISAEHINFMGEDLLGKSLREMREICGNKIGMIFQDPMSSLNPLFTIGNQIMEAMMIHLKISKKEAKGKAIELLKLVEINNPEERLNQYPHQLSGGMRQRVMIAMALSCSPKLLIADEPTTALDVTIQAQILDLMKNLKEKTNTSIILITHDLGVVANMCSRVIVMYGGKVVEKGRVREIFLNPKHPYTKGLLASIPKLENEKLEAIPGSPPDLLNPPLGCAFMSRCKYSMEICKNHDPILFESTEFEASACWLNHPKYIEYSLKKGGEKIE